MFLSKYKLIKQNKMIRKKIKLFLSVTIITLAMSSCTEEFLETLPTDAISTAGAYTNPDNIALVVNGLNRQMYFSALNGATTSRDGEMYFVPAFDYIGGEVIHTGPGFGWQKGEAAWTTHTLPTAATNFNLWYQRYHMINVSSEVIDQIFEQDFTRTPQINGLLGQAYAYRAWAYYRLITTFAKGYIIGNPATDPGVPLITALGAPFEGGPRATVQEIYNQIDADIDEAILYLDQAGARPNKSTIDLNTAYGIKARIALSKGDWGTAATSAAAARNGYPIMDEAEWLQGFQEDGISEAIWACEVIDTESNFFQSYFYYISFAFNGGECRGNNKMINNELYDAIPATDYRTKAWLPLAPNTNSAAYNGQGGSFETDPNYSDAASFNAAKAAIIAEYGATNGHNTHPYMNVKFKPANPGTSGADDQIFMRSSEMVLIEAEAKAMLNDITGAQTALNLLGSARDSAFDVSQYTTQNTLMEQIKFQRRVELWGEGFAYHDKIRWDEGIDQTNSGASIVIYQDGFTQARPSVNDAWIWKIPQAELDANPFIGEADQN